MKNKTLNKLGFIIIIYGLSILFVLLQSMLDVSSIIVIGLILPAPYFLAIYQYMYIKESKHDYKHSLALYKDDNKVLAKEIENYKILDSSRIAIIDKRDNEITELKKNTINSDKYIKATEDVPFNEENDTAEQIWKCPDCGSEMRECKTMYICKNLTCKKRVKKCDL